jgi:hypothetical protein
MESNIKRRRLKISYKLYNAKPTATLKSLLGRDIKILAVKISDCILHDDTIIVDVEYSDISFNSLTIYYVQLDKIKQVIPNSTTYMTTINGHAVKINIKNNLQYKKIIPIKINKMITNNTVENEQVEQQFSYFGIIIRNPLNHYCTIIKHPLHCYQFFDSPPIERIYPQEFKFQASEITTDKITRAYMSTIKNIPSLAFVSDIVVMCSEEVNLINSCTDYTKGYLIDWTKAKYSGALKGIILVQPDRLPYLVVFIPSQTYKMSEEEMKTISCFLDMENDNYLNYHYMVK